MNISINFMKILIVTSYFKYLIFRLLFYTIFYLRYCAFASARRGVGEILECVCGVCEMNVRFSFPLKFQSPNSRNSLSF